MSKPLFEPEFLISLECVCFSHFSLDFLDETADFLFLLRGQGCSLSNGLETGLKTV